MNIVNVIGNVTRDPEVMFTRSGMAKVKFSVASNSRYTSKDGEQKEATDYINVVAWGKLAESISEAVFKGTPVTASYVGVSVYEAAHKKKRRKQKYRNE